VIDKLNTTLPSYSTIKNFALLPHDFTIDSGEITSTLKLKRRVISEKYKDILDVLYSAADSKIDMRNVPQD